MSFSFYMGESLGPGKSTLIYSKIFLSVRAHLHLLSAPGTLHMLFLLPGVFSSQTFPGLAPSSHSSF